MKTFNLYDSTGAWVTCVRAKSVTSACAMLNIPRLGDFLFKWLAPNNKEQSRRVSISGYKAVLQ